jgi:hypothetical protein
LAKACHGRLSGRLRHAKCAAAWVQHTSSARQRNGCGMHPRWRGRGNRIEYTIARPRGSVRGGAGCVVHGGTRQILGRHCESLPAEVRVRGKSRSFVRPTISRLRRVISPNPRPLPASSLRKPGSASGGAGLGLGRDTQDATTWRINSAERGRVEVGSGGRGRAGRANRSRCAPGSDEEPDVVE